MSTAPAGGENKPAQTFQSCLSCRVISGGGLILSGAYVFYAARKFVGIGGPPPIGGVVQMMFAAGLTSWGMVILANPVGKYPKKT